MTAPRGRDGVDGVEHRSEGPDLSPARVPRGPDGDVHVPTRVALRDLVIFQIKLGLDGVGDLVLAPISLVAFVLDLITGNKRRRLFYAVLQAGERWDRWLSLYRPAKEARGTSEGLLGASKIGADTFLGKVEEVVTSQARRTGKGPKDGDGTPR